MRIVTVLLLIVYGRVFAVEPEFGFRPNLAICGNHFPLAESGIILERLVEKYARRHHITERNGGQRLVLIMDNGFYELGGRMTYSTLPFYPDHGGCVFRFETRRYFTGTPVYVVTDGRPETFHVDSIEPFNRLHFQCPNGTRCCGLYCCPVEAQDVQALFTQTSRSSTTEDLFRFLPRTITVVVTNSTTYTLVPPRQLMAIDDSKRVCVYKLQTVDYLRRIGVHYPDGRQINYVFYTCKRTEICCQLRCVESYRRFFRFGRSK